MWPNKSVKEVYGSHIPCRWVQRKPIIIGWFILLMNGRILFWGEFKLEKNCSQSAHPFFSFFSASLNDFWSRLRIGLVGFIQSGLIQVLSTVHVGTVKPPMGTFGCPSDSPYNDCSLNLSTTTMATTECPQLQ